MTSKQKKAVSSKESANADQPLQETPKIFRLRPLPTSSKGRRTRRRLVEAARRVFVKQGFLDTRLIDITSAADCSAGTLYTYFDSKEQIFAAVLQEANEVMLHPGKMHVPAYFGPVAIIEASMRAYLEAYRENADLMALMEQVSQIFPEFRQLRLERGKLFIDRNTRAIANLQMRGLADKSVPAELASWALSTMASRMAYSYFIDRDWMGASANTSLDELAHVLTNLWSNALCIVSHDDDEFGNA